MGRERRPSPFALPVFQGIREATVSGEGRIIYAVTNSNRLLRYRVETGDVQELAPRFPERTGELAEATEKVLRDRVRRVILEQDRRIDDRGSTEILPTFGIPRERFLIT